MKRNEALNKDEYLRMYQRLVLLLHPETLLIVCLVYSVHSNLCRLKIYM